jgi:hypothetical protein
VRLDSLDLNRLSYAADSARVAEMACACFMSSCEKAHTGQVEAKRNAREMQIQSKKHCFGIKPQTKPLSEAL